MDQIASQLARYPALVVELGAVYTLLVALVSRIVSRYLGVPSIVPLLIGGFLAGPAGLSILHISLTEPAVRALLTLAVVVVLFEVTLRIDFQHMPKLMIAALASIGTVLVLVVVPVVARASGFSPLVAQMLASICIVTGPTVIGPLMARLRPRAAVAHLLETEGLVLDSIGVIITAVTFASFTSRPAGPIAATWIAMSSVLAGLAVGAFFGFVARYAAQHLTKMPSDIGKIAILLLAIATYTISELIWHGSGLVAVVACGLLIDYRPLPNQRVLRSFKEDLAMLALSVVFVLLASQVPLGRLGPLLAPAAVITAAIVIVRIATVALGTIRGGLTVSERLLCASIFPRGIVAVSLATYYATQFSAWGLRGGEELMGTLFLIITMTIALSTLASVVVARIFRLSMPRIVMAGISPKTVQAAQHFSQLGYLTTMADRDSDAVAFARASNIDAHRVDSEPALVQFAQARRASTIVVGDRAEWDLADEASDLRIVDLDQLPEQGLRRR